MTYSNAVVNVSFSPDDLLDTLAPVANPPKSAGIVLQWPARQSDRSSKANDELKKAEEILRRLSPQPRAETRGEPGTLLIKHSCQKTPLQEELPAAIKAYDHTLACVREHFPVISVKRTLNLAPMEQAVELLVSSLERNRDALPCVAKKYEQDIYLYSHALNVSIFSSAFALACGKSRDEVVAIGLAGLLHDIGMLLLPLALLRSARQLSPTEQVLVRRHPAIADELLIQLPDVPESLRFAALEHHEWYNGGGYPAGLSKERISFIGHLVAICSAFDAMTSSRRHRTPVSTHAALGEMFKQRNTQFHPHILENFIKMLGIYPVGTEVILKDGYCGIVTASSPASPIRPVVTLLKDPKGHLMAPLEIDMAQEGVAEIARCLTAGEQGLNVQQFLGIPAKK